MTPLFNSIQSINAHIQPFRPKFSTIPTLVTNRQSQKPDLSRSFSAIVTEVCKPSPIINYEQLEKERQANLNLVTEFTTKKTKSKATNFANHVNIYTKQSLKKLAKYMKNIKKYNKIRLKSIMASKNQSSTSSQTSTQTQTRTPISGSTIDKSSDCITFDLVFYDADAILAKLLQDYEANGGSAPIARRPLRSRGKNPLAFPTLIELDYNMGALSLNRIFNQQLR